MPAHVTTVTGTVIGRTMQPLSAAQLPWSSPLTAVAVVLAVRPVIPITPDTKVLNWREAAHLDARHRSDDTRRAVRIGVVVGGQHAGAYDRRVAGPGRLGAIAAEEGAADIRVVGDIHGRAVVGGSTGDGGVHRAVPPTRGRRRTGEVLGEDHGARLGGGIVAGLRDALLGPGVAAVDDEAEARDDGQHGKDHHDEGLAPRTGGTRLVHGDVPPVRLDGMDDMDHGNTRSMGMRDSVVIVTGPMTLPMMGVIAAQSNWTLTSATQPRA